MQSDTVNFWSSLLDFISIELRGFPSSSRVNRRHQEDENNNAAKDHGRTKENEPPKPSTSDDDDVEDPIDSIPENALRHMMALPKRLEGMMLYSLLLCLDALLFEITLMPLQSVGVLVFLVQKGTTWLVRCCRSFFHIFMYPTVSFNMLKRVKRKRIGYRSMIPWNLAFFLRKRANRTLSSNKCSERDAPGIEAEVEPLSTLSENATEKAKDVYHFYEAVQHYECIGFDKPEDRQLPADHDSALPALNLISAWTPLHSLYQGADAYKKPSEYDNYTINPNEACGFMRFMALILGVLILSHIDTSRVYHNIRGQPFIKLYVIFNMLEICERLCRSFGRDCTDILMHSTLKLLKRLSSSRVNSKANGPPSCENIDPQSPPVERHNEDMGSKSNNVAFYEPGARELIRFSSCEDTLIIWPKIERYGTPTLASLGDCLHVESPCNVSDTSSNCSLTTNETNKESHVFFGKDSEGKDPNLETNGSPEGHALSLDNLFIAKVGDRHPSGGSWSPREHRRSVDSLKSHEKVEKLMPLIREFSVRYALVVTYILFHSFMHLVRVLSLNIAINSSDTALFLLLVTNNFAEIKSTVFKKFNNITLFSVVATDSVERFHLCFDSLLVFFKMSTVEDPFKSYCIVFRWLATMFVLEILIDYFKHSFLMKFNGIHGEVHNRYTEVLLGDVLLSRCQLQLEKLTRFNFKIPCRGAYAFPHIPSRRLGFMPSPMLTLIICNIPYIRTGVTLKKFAAAICIWLSLLFLKITTSILLVAHGISNHHKLKELQHPIDTICAL